MSPRTRLIAGVLACLAVGLIWRAWPIKARATQPLALTVDQQARAAAPAPDADEQAGRSEAPAAYSPRRVAATPLVSIVLKHNTLAGAMQEAIARRGRDDPQVISAVLDAVAICQELPEHSSFSNPDSGLMRGHEDPSRIWAIERLEAWCEGLDANALMKQVGTSHADILADAVAGTLEQQLGWARKHIRSENSFEKLLAGRRMIDRGLLSFTRPPDHRVLGKHELFLAWWMASELRSCRAQFGCGPDSPITISYCAEAGCRQGISYSQALQETVPPHVYAGVVFFNQWMTTGR